jgi:hypothetical protein
MKNLSKFVIVLLTMLSFRLQAQNEIGCGTIPSSDSLMETLPWIGNNEILDSFITAGLKRVKDNLPFSIRTGGNTCPEINELIFYADSIFLGSWRK